MFHAARHKSLRRLFLYVSLKDKVSVSSFSLNSNISILEISQKFATHPNRLHIPWRSISSKKTKILMTLQTNSLLLTMNYSWIVISKLEWMEFTNRGSVLVAYLVYECLLNPISRHNLWNITQNLALVIYFFCILFGLSDDFKVGWNPVFGDYWMTN